jgi:hypothetical protein
MNKKTDQKQQTNSNIVWDIIAGAIGYRAVFVAYKLGLFELLAQTPHSLAEISKALNIAARPAEALLLANLSLELLQREGDFYVVPDRKSENSQQAVKNHREWTLSNSRFSHF